MNGIRARVTLGRACFVRACELDVLVRKPGNVSINSPGHAMHAAQFVASARAAAGPLFEPGARVGARIEASVRASWEAAGCNTNLGIVLLCAPVAAALEREAALVNPLALQLAIVHTLDQLDLEDTRATYRAIALANPAGLGGAPREDVHAAPRLKLREAMALASDRDSIARQYANGYADLFALELALLAPPLRKLELAPAGPEATADASTSAIVQQLYLEFLSRFPDSHIVRKHGEVVAHTVMRAAQAWHSTSAPDADALFEAWDESLKAQRINPGTSADLTVTALLLAGVLAAPGHTWHGS